VLEDDAAVWDQGSECILSFVAIMNDDDLERLLIPLHMMSDISVVTLQ
jgi:hypothetical protein